MLPHFPLPWLWRFIYMFVFRLGILDGAPGWVLCNLISVYQLFILTKYRELRRYKPMDPMPRSALKLAEGSMGAIASTPAPVLEPLPTAPRSPASVQPLAATAR